MKITKQQLEKLNKGETITLEDLTLEVELKKTAESLTLDGVKLEIAVEEKGVFIPEIDQEYYYIDDGGITRLITNLGSYEDKFRIRHGNCFKIQDGDDQSRKTGYHAKVRALVAIDRWIAEKGYEFDPDWSDAYQKKHTPYYNHTLNEFVVNCYSNVQDSLLPHFSQEKHGEELIKECEKPLLVLIGKEGWGD